MAGCLYSETTVCSISSAKQITPRWQAVEASLSLTSIVFSVRSSFAIQAHFILGRHSQILRGVGGAEEGKRRAYDMAAAWWRPTRGRGRGRTGWATGRRRDPHFARRPPGPQRPALRCSARHPSTAALARAGTHDARRHPSDRYVQHARCRGAKAQTRAIRQGAAQWSLHRQW